MAKNHTDTGIQVADIIALIHIIGLFIFLLKSLRSQGTSHSVLTGSGSSSVPVEMSGRVRSGSGTHSRWPL